MNHLQDEFDNEIREVSAKIDRTEEDIRKEADERTQADDNITRMIEEATIGGLTLEVVGLLWLTLGVLGQGCPDEIAKVITHMTPGAAVNAERDFL